MKPDRKQRLNVLTALMLGILAMAALCWLVGSPLIRFASQPERFRQWVDAHGLWGGACLHGNGDASGDSGSNSRGAF